jgi:hypothetical protein
MLKRQIMSMEQFAHAICDTMRPSCVYSVTTKQPPLPYWCPALKACSARIGYAHNMERDERTAILASGLVDHSSTSASDAAATQKSPLMKLLHPSSNGFIEGISKFEFNLMDRNDVLQLAIKPCWEWMTPRTRERPHVVSLHEQPPSTLSSSSVLFHARRDGSSYAWCRFMSSSLTPLNDSGSLHDESSVHQSDNQNKAKSQANVYSRLFETTVRMSTLISLPLASLSSIRVTPTLKCLQTSHSLQLRMRKRRTMGTGKTTEIDASCQFEATSGGQGRTTATLTVSPLDSTQFMKLAMEYRLSGFGIPKYFHRHRRHIESKDRSQAPQHWIRQLWEWNRPSFPSRSSVREKDSTSFMMERYRSAKTTIMASQYQWLMVWPSGQSFRTIFDPPRIDFKHDDGRMNGAVSFTWIDPTKQNIHDVSTSSGITGGVGAWITEVRVPFLDSARKDESLQHDSLLFRNLGAAEVRVRRQFCF